MLHLRTHLDLINEPPTNEYCWIQVDLDQINRKILASFCQVLASKSKRIPFGYTYNGVYFTRAGDFVPRDLGEGLTCATFIMAVFSTYSVPLLLEAEWPVRPEDTLWQVQHSNILTPRFGPVISDAIAKHMGGARFRPTEVAAGAGGRPKPMPFATAEKLAKRIAKDLERASKSK